MTDDGYDALRRARDLIADEEHWTTGEFARDADGKDVDPRDPAAVRWCVAGAMRREDVPMHAWSLVRDAAVDALGIAAWRRCLDWTGDANDGLGHAAAVGMLDRVLANNTGHDVQ